MAPVIPAALANSFSLHLYSSYCQGCRRVGRKLPVIQLEKQAWSQYSWQWTRNLAGQRNDNEDVHKGDMIARRYVFKRVAIACDQCIKLAMAWRHMGGFICQGLRSMHWHTYLRLKISLRLKNIPPLLHRSYDEGGLVLKPMRFWRIKAFFWITGIEAASWLLNSLWLGETQVLGNTFICSQAEALDKLSAGNSRIEKN